MILFQCRAFCSPHCVQAHRVCCVVVSFPIAQLLCLGVASLHGLACFPPLTMMSLFPADQPLSRTWSMGTQMAWETAKVSRPSSLLSFLLYPTPPTTTTITATPLFSVNSVSLFSRPCVFLLRCCHLVLPPSVPPSQSSLSASSIHLSLFGSRPLLSSHRCLSGPPVNRVLCPLGQRLDRLFAIGYEKHNTNIQRDPGNRI